MAKEKQLTKGQKQIYEENKSTMQFYLLMTAISSVIHFVVLYFIFHDTTSRNSWIFFVTSVLGQLGALKCMHSMAKATRSDTGQLIDAGIDLNMEGGFGEYCKDIVILSSVVQILSMITVWFWILYTAAPLFAAYKLWTSVISPWVFAPGPAPEEDEKEGKGKRGKREQRKARW